jgi:hypothetical protein
MTLDLSVGQNTYATQLPKNLVAWHSRDSAGAVSGVGATETGVIRVDSVTIRNGYHYLIDCPEVNITIAGTNPLTAVGLVKLRFSTSGSATTSSSVIPYGGFYRQAQAVSNSSTNVSGMQGMYHASADGNLSIIMTVIRDLAGTGTNTVGVFASTTNPCSMFIYEMGLYPAVSGVDL